MEKRAGFFICICPDPEIIRDFISSTIHGFDGTWQKKTFWGDEDLSRFFNCFRSSTLLGSKLAIVLRNAEKLPKNFWDKLSYFLKKFYPEICPFICIEEEWNKGQPPKIKALTSQKYYQFAEKKKWIFKHPGVTEEFLLIYLKKWAKEKNVTLDPRVIIALKEILPMDLAAIKQELKKLEFLITKKDKVTIEDLRIISPSFEYNVFDIINSIENIIPKHKVWSILLKNELSTHEVILPILHLLLREARIFWKLYHGEKVSLPNWITQKKSVIAKKLGIDGIIQIWNIVLDADLKLKTSNLNPKEILESVVVRLQELFS